MDQNLLAAAQVADQQLAAAHPQHAGLHRDGFVARGALEIFGALIANRFHNGFLPIIRMYSILCRKNPEVCSSERKAAAEAFLGISGHLVPKGLISVQQRLRLRRQDGPAAVPPADGGI